MAEQSFLESIHVRSLGRLGILCSYYRDVTSKENTCFWTEKMGPKVPTDEREHIP